MKNELVIGFKFKIGKDDLWGKAPIHYDAEIIGIYYFGCSSSSKIQTRQELLKTQIKTYQIIIQARYGPEIIEINEKDFLTRIEEDKKFVTEYKKYLFAA